MTDDREQPYRLACPECDGIDVSARSRGPGYYCHTCGATFRYPTGRRRKQDGGRRRGLPGVLEAMDPDEVPPDV